MQNWIITIRNSIIPRSRKESRNQWAIRHVHHISSNSVMLCQRFEINQQSSSFQVFYLRILLQNSFKITHLNQPFKGLFLCPFSTIQRWFTRSINSTLSSVQRVHWHWASNKLIFCQLHNLKTRISMIKSSPTFGFEVIKNSKNRWESLFYHYGVCYSIYCLTPIDAH